MSMQVKDWIQFAKFWNKGMSVKELAHKFGASEATVRNWVNVLRKKGVSLNKRVRGTQYDLSKDDVASINKHLG